MSNIIQIKHGSDRPTSKLAEYELGYCTTDKKLYIGDFSQDEQICGINAHGAEILLTANTDAERQGELKRLEVGRDNNPVYFYEGIPVQCTTVVNSNGGVINNGSLIITSKNYTIPEEDKNKTGILYVESIKGTLGSGDEVALHIYGKPHVHNYIKASGITITDAGGISSPYITASSHFCSENTAQIKGALTVNGAASTGSLTVNGVQTINIGSVNSSDTRRAINLRCTYGSGHNGGNTPINWATGIKFSLYSNGEDEEAYRYAAIDGYAATGWANLTGLRFITKNQNDGTYMATFTEGVFTTPKIALGSSSYGTSLPTDLNSYPVGSIFFRVV